MYMILRSMKRNVNLVRFLLINISWKELITQFLITFKIFGLILISTTIEFVVSREENGKSIENAI